MQRALVVLLYLGFVGATLQNFTVDDTSPDIIYGGNTFQCDSNSCPPEITEGGFNHSATVTTGSITFTFTGTAVYASLDLLGTCTFTVDDGEPQTLTVSVADTLAGVRGNISAVDLANGPHTLIIAPSPTNFTLIGFDHLIYTASLPGKKSHVGAIVGAVVGGIVLTVGALFLAVLARRRRLIMRRNQRKSAVLRRMTFAQADRKGGQAGVIDLPT
ncbi:hypothetical protein B0H16DRAFT_1493669 [Mycena metata]|uniref:Uncharacterized protein n=1 Tax=Mycena metata TaxID=1033252 RepID=A0AAD7KHE7_9AGAR|nr:hypothetical protein B0H16DRAFT_325476 [Mycena metata]KAJ7784757.1 hypothetical protein B0H16DRAFT_1493669 [Mycena metata]